MYVTDFKNPLCFPCFASSRKQGDPDYDIHLSGRVMEFLSCWHACDKLNMLKQCLYSPFIPTNQLQRKISKLLNLRKTFKFPDICERARFPPRPQSRRNTNNQFRMALQGASEAYTYRKTTFLDQPRFCIIFTILH